MAQPARLIITGSSQAGKSYWTKRYIAKAQRVLVVDHLQEYQDLTAIAGPGLRKLISFFTSFLPDRPQSWALAYRPGVDSLLLDFDMICTWAWEIGNLTFVIEEISWYASNNRMPPALANLVARGRHRGIQMIVTAQRPAQIPMLYRENATRLICFRCHEPNSLDYLRTWIRSGDDRLVDQLPLFHVGQYLDYDCASGIGKIVKRKS